MAVHELKTWPEPFAAVRSGDKRHEVRRDDRGFAVGDTLRLREWDPAAASFDLGTRGRYTGRVERVRVTYLTRGPEWGVPAGMVVMSIRLFEHGYDDA